MYETMGNYKNEDGLSLIEVCIALLIIGIISVPIMLTYQIEAIREMHGDTLGHINTTEAALLNFHSSGNEYYPCPASLIAQHGDADFGAAATACSNDFDISDIERCDDPDWLNFGICKTHDAPANAVIYGGVPFSALKMTMGQELDAWGNKLIYGVGFNQTQPTTFENGNNIMPLSGDNPNDASADGIPDQVTSAAGTAMMYQYVIFSTGENARGGFTKNGTRISLCDNAANELSDLENCDLDATVLLREDPNFSGTSVVSASGLIYDDYTAGADKPFSSIWGDSRNNADTAYTMATRVGIGTQDPQQSFHVYDDIVANANLRIEGTYNSSGDLVGGKLKTNNVCAEGSSSTECFNPVIIAGSVPEMQCDNSYRAVNELSNSRVRCITTQDANGNDIDGNALSVGSTYSGACSETVSGGGTIPRPATGFDTSGAMRCN